MLFLPAIGVGIGWASTMRNPYVIAAGSIPPERTWMYGIFNMMIVFSMLLVAATLPSHYGTLTHGDPHNMPPMCSVLMSCAAVAMFSLRAQYRRTTRWRDGERGMTR